MPPNTTGLKGFHIPSLDGLRAISIFIVFLSHVGLHRVVPGLFGVTVFFFLSGYLITTLMRLECERTGGLSLRDFFARRALRILPPFYLVLGALVWMTSVGVLKGDISGPAVVAQALHFGNYQEIFGHGAQPPGTEVLWSLAVEEHFYLLFPFLYLALRRWLPQPRRQFFALAGLAFAVLGWRMILIHGLHAISLDPSISHHPRICHATDTRLDSLLFGCMLAVYGNPALDASRFQRATWLGVGLPLGLGALLLSFVLRAPAFRETFRYTLQGLALFPVFIVAIRFADWGVFRFLNHPWVRVAGILSYPIYLTHSGVIAGVQQWYPTVIDSTGSNRLVHQMLQGVIALGISLGISWVLHHGLEKPCARLRRRLSHLHTKPSSPQLIREANG